MPSRFAPPAAYQPADPSWEFLPFQFERLSPNRVLVTNMVGEHLFVSADDFAALMGKKLDPASPLRDGSAPNTSFARPARSCRSTCSR